MERREFLKPTAVGAVAPKKGDSDAEKLKSRT